MPSANVKDMQDLLPKTTAAKLENEVERKKLNVPASKREEMLGEK